MPVSDRNAALATRIGQEIKACRGLVGIAPPVGWMVRQEFSASGTSAPVVSRLNLTPIHIGWTALTVDAIGLQVTTAMTAGSGVAVQLGIYGCTAEGLPLTTGGPIATASVGAGTTASPALTTAGAKWATLSAPVALRGRYWLASLYTYSAAPTTAPVFATASGVAVAIPAPISSAINAVVRGFTRLSQTALPTDDTSVSAGNMAAITGTDAPLLALRRSA